MSVHPYPRGREGRADCRSYDRGHVPTTVMVTLAQQGELDDWVRVSVLDVTAEVVTLAAPGMLVRVRTHDAPLLASLRAGPGASALLNEEYGLLVLPPRPDGGSPIFSVQDVDAAPTPCHR